MNTNELGSLVLKKVGNVTYLEDTNGFISIDIRRLSILQQEYAERVAMLLIRMEHLYKGDRTIIND